MEFKYTGSEDKFVFDSTGERIFVKHGDVFTMKTNPQCDNIEEVKKEDNKRGKKKWQQ